MIRSDREIKDPKKIQAILEECKICRIGLYDENRIYVVPVSQGYVYDAEKGKLTLYFHGAKRGHKLDLIRKNPQVGFELDSGPSLMIGKVPCDYGNVYASMIGSGTAVILEDPQEKQDGLSLIMQSQANVAVSFNEKQANSVAVYKIEVAEFTCKSNRE